MRIVVIIFALLTSGTAFAAGDAGCGLGSLIISKNSKLLQLFAATTNGTFGSQTFGITSGTSNCSSSGLVNNEKEIDYFVEVNHDDLSREMAQGHGEKLTTLAALHGCSSEATIKAFGSKAQSHFEQIVPAAGTNGVDMARNLKAISLKDACQGS